MRAALYTRVSTKEQTEGLSLDNQRFRLTEWAKREDWEIVGDYQDAGFSGRSTNRPAFQQMLAEAERGGFDILLARVRERVFRNALGTAHLQHLGGDLLHLVRRRVVDRGDHTGKLRLRLGCLSGLRGRGGLDRHLG